MTDLQALRWINAVDKGDLAKFESNLSYHFAITYFLLEIG